MRTYSTTQSHKICLTNKKGKVIAYLSTMLNVPCLSVWFDLQRNREDATSAK